ncbi:hypothetical protein NM688_g4588 [Phlebia brevispora]|uniref:Uncharacterized protein n=1 Tax=Phlebia brevispora TaxID=194682 RepID=A0ACC1T2U4_9APHY|nr:hypothetical protein NM688_g4588 [Phlebia brevispora]
MSFEYIGPQLHSFLIGIFIAYTARAIYIILTEASFRTTLTSKTQRACVGVISSLIILIVVALYGLALWPAILANSSSPVLDIIRPWNVVLYFMLDCLSHITLILRIYILYARQTRILLVSGICTSIAAISLFCRANGLAELAMDMASPSLGIAFSFMISVTKSRTSVDGLVLSSQGSSSNPNTDFGAVSAISFAPEASSDIVKDEDEDASSSQISGRMDASDSNMFGSMVSVVDQCGSFNKS